MRSRQESREMPLSSVLQGLGPGDRCYPPFGDRCYFDYDDTETVVCDYGMYMIAAAPAPSVKVLCTTGQYRTL